MDTPEAIRARASALVEYLLAVRALLERPVRTVPATDAFWQADLPAHPAGAIRPGDSTGPWLRVARPPPAAPPARRPRRPPRPPRPPPAPPRQRNRPGGARPLGRRRPPRLRRPTRAPARLRHGTR